MRTTKVILEGDTSRFAFGVSFQKDPDDGVGATQEESISWGGLQIWVESVNLCAHREGDTIVEDVHWYLLPVFEWVSACWDYLMHEERLPLRVAGEDSWRSLQATVNAPAASDEKREESWGVEWQAWWLRHSLLACRQGGLFPDVVFRRWRDRLEVSWGQRRLAGQPDYFRFLTAEGFARMPVAEVAEPIFAVLRQAADHLVSQAPESKRFMKFRTGLESLKAHRTTKRLAILAGLGTTVEDQERRWDQVTAPYKARSPAALEATFGIDTTDLYLAGSCQAALMFGSVAPTVDAGDAVALAGKLIDLYSPNGEPPQLTAICRDEIIDDSSKRPWAQGYRLAEDLLDDLSLPLQSDGWVDVRKIYESLGIHIDDFYLKDSGIRAISVASPEHRPSTLLNTNHVTYVGESGKRFTLAHELCHILFDRGYGAKLAIASGPWAPSDVEARANAFAAMLLMPTELVRRLVRSQSVPVNSLAGVREMADKLHASIKATLEHLKNLNFLSEEEHDLVVNELDG